MVEVGVSHWKTSSPLPHWQALSCYRMIIGIYIESDDLFRCACRWIQTRGLGESLGLPHCTRSNSEPSFLVSRQKRQKSFLLRWLLPQSARSTVDNRWDGSKEHVYNHVIAGTRDFTRWWPVFSACMNIKSFGLLTTIAELRQEIQQHIISYRRRFTVSYDCTVAQ